MVIIFSLGIRRRLLPIEAEHLTLREVNVDVGLLEGNGNIDDIIVARYRWPGAMASIRGHLML